MDHSRYQESQQLWIRLVVPETREKPSNVQIDVVVQPVVNNDVPFAIVCAKFNRVPPVEIEDAIWKTGEFSPAVEPTVQKAKESKDEEEHGWKHKPEHTGNEFD